MASPGRLVVSSVGSFALRQNEPRYRITRLPPPMLDPFHHQRMGVFSMTTRALAIPAFLGLICIVSTPPSVEAQGLLKRLFGKKRSCVTRASCFASNCRTPSGCRPVQCKPPCLQDPMSRHGIPCLCNCQYLKEKKCCEDNHPEGSGERQFCVWAAEERYKRCLRGPRGGRTDGDPDCPQQCGEPNYGCDGYSGFQREYCLSMYQAICDDCQ